MRFSLVSPFEPQFKFHLRAGGRAGVQPRGRGPDPHDEPARVVGRPDVQRNPGRGDADVEERGLLRSVQGILAQLAATGALEHHRILQQPLRGGARSLTARSECGLVVPVLSTDLFS